MVADHVTLKVKEGTTEAQLATYAQAHGGSILRRLRVPGPGTYLVKYDEATVDTVPTAVAALSQPDAPVQYVNPDYVVYTCETIPNDPRFSELWGMHNTGQIAGTGTVVVATNTLSGNAMAYSPVAPPPGVTGILYYCALGKAGEFPPGTSNYIALIQRGETTFAEKAANAKAAGAKAVIVYNNVSGALSGTFQTAGDWLPCIGVSDTAGARLLTLTNTLATVTIYGSKVDADIDAPEAWDISTGSTNVVVGIIDTGIDYNHPDLASNIWVNTAELNGTPGVDDDGNGFIDDVHGVNFITSTGDPMDDFFHGTHCAGTIGEIGRAHV
jgi:subtilisin family serine protease